MYHVSQSPCRRYSFPFLNRTLSLAAALKVLAVPIVLAINWELLSPLVAPGLTNPFTPLFLISGRLDHFSDDDPRYRKTYWDLAFVAYYIVFFSLFREVIATNLARRVGRYYGLRKPGKLDRFGEQAHAFVYFTIMGAWGFVRISLNIPFFSRVLTESDRESCPSYRHTGTKRSTFG